MTLSAATTLQRQVENAALVGRVGKPAVRTNQVAGQQPFQTWQDTEQDGLEGQPRHKGPACPPKKRHQQRDHKTPGFSDSDSLRRINHSSETVL